MRTTFIEDIEDNYDWYSRFISYDENDSIQTISFVYDDQTEFSARYEDGVLRSTSFQDLIGTFYQPAGMRPWESINTTYTDEGVLERREYYFDNGNRRTDTYQDGVISKSTYRDAGWPLGNRNVEIWTSIEINYDSSGAILDRLTIYDTGVEKLDTFANGRQTTSVLEDNPAMPADGVKDWHKITLEYDPSGQVTARATEYDNGELKWERYTDGVRTELRRFDGLYEVGLTPFQNNHDWREIQITYDAETGEMRSNTYRYDDGSSRVLSYVDGQLSMRLETDGSGDNSAHDWLTILTEYTEGRITLRTTEFDNGKERVESFSEGRLTSILEIIPLNRDQFSAPEACVFQGTCPPPPPPPPERPAILERETLFDEAGAVTQRNTLYSNDDRTAAFYENGRITEQHLLDGDDDQAWLGRKIIYGIQFGGPWHFVADTIEFYSEDDLPADFAFCDPGSSDPVPDAPGPDGTTTTVTAPVTTTFGTATPTDGSAPDPESGPPSDGAPPTVPVTTTFGVPASDADGATSTGSVPITTTTGGASTTDDPETTPPVQENGETCHVGGAPPATGSGTAPTVDDFTGIPGGSTPPEDPTFTDGSTPTNAPNFGSNTGVTATSPTAASPTATGPTPQAPTPFSETVAPLPGEPSGWPGTVAPTTESPTSVTPTAQQFSGITGGWPGPVTPTTESPTSVAPTADSFTGVTAGSPTSVAPTADFFTGLASGSSTTSTYTAAPGVTGATGFAALNDPEDAPLSDALQGSPETDAVFEFT